MWSQTQIEYHQKAANLLIKIKDLTFNYIRKNNSVTEYDIQQFILEKYEFYNLDTDKDPPIVAFNQHSATPEFYPKKISTKLRSNTFF